MTTLKRTEVSPSGPEPGPDLQRPFAASSWRSMKETCHMRHPNRTECVLVFVPGYDSDVAREKAVDYTTKMFAVGIREMRGTKPQQQLKELSGEER